MKMSNETKTELVKAFAYGMSTKEVADIEDMDESDAQTFASENASAIAERKAALTEQGWM